MPLASRHPVHITLKLRREIGSLRTKRKVQVLRRALAAHGSRKEARPVARVIHWSIQRDHIHLICEAKNQQALSRGIQGLSIRIAKRLNGLLGRKGPVFQDRYHAHILRSPREVRNALLYVLNNVRKHAAQPGKTLAALSIDTYSSAPTFNGWRDLPEHLRGIGPPQPVASTWLLRVGWRRHGLLSISDIPK
ncbi:MAG: transposase [Myxococcota bacterium]